MKSMNKTIVVSVLLIVIIGVGYFYYQYQNKAVRAEEEVSKFLLVNYFFPNRNLIGQSVLARFWVKTAYNPIMALPGVDTTELEKVVNALEEGQMDYLKFYNDSDKKVIEEMLHPFDFLKGLPALEEARRDFLSEPSYFKAINYSLRLNQSLKKLQDYTLQLSNLFNEFDKNLSIEYMAGSTSNHHVALQLAKINLETSNKLDESRKRIYCLLGFNNSDDCRLQIVRTLSDRQVEQSKFEKEEMIFFGSEIKSYLQITDKKTLSLTDKPALDLPLVYLETSRCTVDESSVYVFTWLSSRMSGLASFWSTPVSEIFFHDVKSGTNNVHKALSNVGVSYEYQSLNPYLCIDANQDMARVRTAYYIHNQLVNQPFFTEKDTTKWPLQLKILAELEYELTNQTDFVSVPLLGQYLVGLETIIYSDDSEFTSQFDSEDVLAMLGLVNLWKAKTAWWETELATIDDMAMTNRYVMPLEQILLNPLFMTRSYFTSTIMTSNQTLYESQVLFIEKRNREKIGLPGMVNYKSYLKDIVEATDLSEFIAEQDILSDQVYRP